MITKTCSSGLAVERSLTGRPLQTADDLEARAGCAGFSNATLLRSAAADCYVAVDPAEGSGCEAGCEAAAASREAGASRLRAQRHTAGRGPPWPPTGPPKAPSTSCSNRHAAARVIASWTASRRACFSAKSSAASACTRGILSAYFVKARAGVLVVQRRAPVHIRPGSPPPRAPRPKTVATCLLLPQLLAADDLVTAAPQPGSTDGCTCQLLLSGCTVGFVDLSTVVIQTPAAGQSHQQGCHGHRSWIPEDAARPRLSGHGSGDMWGCRAFAQTGAKTRHSEVLQKLLWESRFERS